MGARGRKLALGVAVLLMGAPVCQRPGYAQEVPEGSAHSPRATLDRYCVGCHNEKLRTAGLSLDGIDPAHVTSSAATWEKVVQKLRSGTMPPAGMPRPDKATYESVATRLEAALDQEAKARPNVGAPALHRLNRTEYANAISDLLALDVDVASLLPPDDSSSGFDNMADVLKVSPLLLEQYLIAARRISRLATGNPALGPVIETYRAEHDLTQNDHLEGLPLGTRGGLVARHYFPLDGEYEIRLLMVHNRLGIIRGLDDEHRIEVTVDGTPVQQFTIGGEGSYEPLPGGSGGLTPITKAQTADADLHFRLPVKAGPHLVAAAFIKKTNAHLEVEDVRQPLRRRFFNNLTIAGEVDMASMAIGGPYGPTWPGDTPSRRRIFTCHPARVADEAPCARSIVSKLARRAYRGPVHDADLQSLLAFYEAGRRKGTFESGIELALQRMLASPQFLFRFERDPENLAPGTSHPISDVELASRLSFFLWSSVPDDELLEEAERGRLREPAVLERQVRRMLANPRSRSIATNFAGQWLFLRNLRGWFPIRGLFPEFDDNLRQAFVTETEMFFESIMRENRSVVDFLDADYTFVNERLARHYGIPKIYGTRFRRVRLADDRRRGLLGHGSILTVTSYENRTAPTIRGKWVLENLLGAPPPPPPPDVPALEDDDTDGRGNVLPMREQMQRHRKNPVCASCHSLMDPLGFMLENYDAIGQWRDTVDGRTPIDASGVLLDGTVGDGPAGLRRTLLAHRVEFVRTLTQKLFTYALGRGIEHHDMPAVRQILRTAAADDYRWSALVLGIINSAPFQMRTSPERPVTPSGSVASLHSSRALRPR